mgnify:FL=1
MKLVVTGALGHIGSRLTRALGEALPDAEVVLVDNLCTQRYASLFDLPTGGFRFHELDVLEADLGPVFAGAHAVIHLAALTDAAGSFARREQVERDNLRATERVAQAAADAGARLFYVSSTSVYGSADAVVDESSPVAPQSPYAETKLKEEAAVHALTAKGLRAVVCRFGTIYGVSPGMRFHTAVNKFCWQAVMGQPVTVWRTALDQKRPYLDLEDAVGAVLFFLRHDRFDGAVYNVLTGNHAVREVVEVIKELVPSLQVELVDAAIMNQLSYDVSDARVRALGFEPKGSLRRGVGDTIARLRGANSGVAAQDAGASHDRPAGTMYTREEFEALRAEWAREMAADARLADQARDLLVRADRHNWIHQGSWFGEPLLNLPQDVFALQEIIWRTRPQWIVEVGVAWGGSLLFYATLLQALGGGGVIGVDIYVPEDLRARIDAYGALTRDVHWVVGSSVEQATVDQVKALLGGDRRVLVLLDSHHTHDHVLAELRAYAPLVGAGHYLVCGDTVVEQMPPQTHRPRPWGPGNNPATALRAWLGETDRFEVDCALEQKLLLTCNPGGYLRATKD